MWVAGCLAGCFKPCLMRRNTGEMKMKSSSSLATTLSKPELGASSFMSSLSAFPFYCVIQEWYHCRILTLQRLWPKPKESISPILRSGSLWKALIILSIVKGRCSQSVVSVLIWIHLCCFSLSCQCWGTDPSEWPVRGWKASVRHRRTCSWIHSWE